MLGGKEPSADHGEGGASGPITRRSASFAGSHRPQLSSLPLSTAFHRNTLLSSLPRYPAMSKELGTLVVVVLKAKNLHDRHSFYKQDPYAKITLDGKTKKTDVDVKGGQHPEWDAELRFDVYTSKKASARTLEVSCWRAESREHEEIGKGTVDISDTLEKHEFDGEREIPSGPLWLAQRPDGIHSHNLDS